MMKSQIREYTLSITLFVMPATLHLACGYGLSFSSVRIHELGQVDPNSHRVMPPVKSFLLIAKDGIRYFG